VVEAVALVDDRDVVGGGPGTRRAHVARDARHDAADAGAHDNHLLDTGE
jgi:hypothetical protein